MTRLNTIAAWVKGVFSDAEDPAEPRYDPAHLAAVLVLSFAAMALLFWLLWALLVFGGGIQSKVLPFIQVVFTGKTMADFGYDGYPYAMGVFEGWVTNLAALIIFLGLITAVRYLFNRAPAAPREGRGTPDHERL